jgi:hypothetical protein
MKNKLLSIAAGVALTVAASAQSINVTSTGVGIGTATPTQKLDVAGNIAATGNVAASGNITAAGDFYGSNKLTILGNTSIGSGASPAVAKFDIAAPGGTVPLLSLRATLTGVGQYQMIRFGDASQITDYQKGAIIYESVSPVARGRMHLALENTDGAGSVALSDAKLTVLSSGGVGIGTATPEGKLSIAGALPFTGFTGSYDTNDSLNFFQLMNNSYSIQTLLDARTLAGYNYGGDENRLYLQPMAGWVGIGTHGVNNYGHRLVVNGTVKSKGFVTDASAWSDYVLAKDYKLPTLTEVEQHIATNGHLPGIPSEKEVLAKGFNLAEMDSKLLAQIEQLTLHMIFLNKKMEAQQEEIKALRSASGGVSASLNLSK